MIEVNKVYQVDPSAAIGSGRSASSVRAAAADIVAALPVIFFEALLEECRAAAALGEVPVAALVYEAVHRGAYRVLALASNRTVDRRDPTAHCEVEAIRQACRLQANQRLPRAGLISTLEPCTMCTGAIVQARLAEVIYLAPGDHGPGLQYLLRKTRHTPERFNHYPVVAIAHAYRERYLELLQSFFASRRQP